MSGSKKANPKEVIELLKTVSLDQLFVSIRRKAIADSKDVVDWIKEIFRGSPPVNDVFASRRIETYKFAVKLLQTVDLPSKIFTELISLLIVETENFATTSLMKIAKCIVSELKEMQTSDGKWLEVLPKVLSTLAGRDTILYQGIDMSGADLKNEIVKSLCNSAVKPNSIVHLVSVLKDVELTDDELKLVVSKTVGSMSEMKYQELPTFVFQFLQLSAKGQQKTIMRSLISYFIDEDNKVRLAEQDVDSDDLIEKPDSTNLRQIEGTVILLIQDSCRQDVSLGKTFISMLKSFQHVPEVALCPFIFSTTLSLSRIQRYEEQIMDVLKGTVLHTFRQKEKSYQSLWIRGLLPPSENIVEHVKETISNSKHGWDHVGSGLVKFGFFLLDAFGPKFVCGRMPDLTKPHTVTATEQACSLGSVILRNSFKIHRSMRSEVFEQILSRVITKSSTPVLHYIDVLSQTVQGDPQLLLEVLTKVMEILDYLPFLPYSNALAILKSLTPLLKISMPLKDTLMLVLRKALFDRDLEPRKIAISGYLAILKKISSVGKLSLSQSQSSLSSQASTSSFFSQPQEDGSSGNIAKLRSMCLEIMGILKRTLIQQAEVKQLLYEGLYDVVVHNLSIVDIVLELLLCQFEKFYDVSSNTLPLDITSCIRSQKDTIVINEPIAHLLTAIYLMLYEVKHREDCDDDDSEFEQSAQGLLVAKFKTLTTSMSKMEVDDFKLDKTEDLDKSDTTLKKETACLLLGAYDALMEYSLMNNQKYNVESCEELLLLFAKHEKIAYSFSEKKSKTSKSKASTTTLPKTHFTVRFLAVITEAMFSNSDTQHEQGLSLLRADTDFVKYILRCCNEKLTSYSESGRSDGFSECMENAYSYICTISKVFLKVYSEGLDPSKFASFDRTELSYFFINGLSLAFSFMSSVKSSSYLKFVNEIGKNIPSADGDAPARVVKKFQRLAIKSLGDTEDDDDNLKEVIHLLSIIGHLLKIPSNMENVQVYQWAKQLSVEQTFEDLSVAKKLLTLCLTLSHQHKEHVKFLKEIAHCIHYYLHDIEPETAVRGTPAYNIINARTATGVLPLLVTNVEQILDEVEWVLNVMKSETTFLSNPLPIISVKQSEVGRKEEQTCIILIELMKVFNEMVQTAIPVGYSLNSVLRVVTSLYKCLTLMCKYYTMLYDQKCGQLHPMFEKVTKVSGLHLTSQVYAFITYIQNVEAENLNTNKKKNKHEGAPQTMREVKLIPPLVFAIEVYERHLIILSKKANKDLMAHIKLSTARDFRIDQAAVQAALERDDDDNEDAKKSDDESVSNDATGSELLSAVKNASPQQKKGGKRKRGDMSLSRKKAAKS